MSGVDDLGKQFVPSVTEPVMHGAGGSPEANTKFPDEELSLEQIQRIIANHESGVQLTGVHLYRQLAAVTRERDALAHELREIQRVSQTYNQPDRRDIWKWLNEIGDIAAKVLARLASGELRGPV